MLLKHAYRYTRRRLDAVWPRIFLWALVIPWLRVRRVFGKQFSVVPAYRGAVILDRNRLYKVALSRKSTIDIEYKNYAAAGQKWPELLTILPDCQFENDSLVSYLSMSRYQPVALDDSIAHASSMYRLMRTCCSANARPMAIWESGELLAGIEVIAELYGDSKSRAMRQHVESFLQSGDYHLGFAHGDFHSRNIMIDDRGAPRLVDLDCIRLNGIQELDALYFVLEWEWSRSGRPWHNTIVDFLRGTASGEHRAMLRAGFGVEESFGLVVTYLVDRVGQECRNFDVRWYNRAALDPAISQMGAVPNSLSAA
jgi:hypothetical protein